MTTLHQVLLDTDPGIGDALAIPSGLASPKIRFVGLSVVHGSCPLTDALQDALDVLALGGAPDPPVASGRAVPLLRPPFTAPKIHGTTGLGYARAAGNAPNVQQVTGADAPALLDLFLERPSGQAVKRLSG